MKRSIRIGVFETNSSSVHSITMCSKEEYEKWKNGDLLLDYYKEDFVSKEKAIQDLKEDNDNQNVNFDDEEEVNDLLYENELKTYKQYFEGRDYETFKDTYTTKNGEEIIAFGYFGYNG